MDAYFKMLFAILNLFGYSFGYFQWSVQHKAVMCLGGDANLIWDYETNETASIFLWEKLGSPNILVARIFAGTFNAIAPYNGRVTQTNLGNAAILLSSVTANDSGTYGCTIQSFYSENITLVVAETPSGLPYFNKTGTSLTCNPPLNLGSPPVETKLKFQNGTTSSSLTTTESGTYQCCITGDAVRCLSSTSNTATEACVKETLDLETTTITTTSQTTTEHGTTSTELQTSPQRETTDSVSTNTETKTTRSYYETTTKPITSNISESGQTATESTTTLEAESSLSSTTTVYTSTKKPSGSHLAGETIIIITVCSVVGFIIILFIVIIVIYKRGKNPIEKHHKQEHINKFHKQKEKKDIPVKTIDDINDWDNCNKYDLRRGKERHIAHYEYPNKKKITTHSYTTYKRPRRYDHIKYNNTNTISTYYPRMYGGSHNYDGFHLETSPYGQNYQNYHESIYYDQQKLQLHTNKLHKHQKKRNKPVKTFNDINAWDNSNEYDMRREKEDRHIAQDGYPNKKTSRSYTTYQNPRGYDYNKYNNTNTISTYYPRMYGESHNYGFERQTSPYEQNYQYYTGSIHGSSYYD